MGRATLAIALASLTLALLAAIAGAVALPGGRPSVSLGMMLRLHDLPPGYVVVDDEEDVACFRLDLEGADPPLAEYLSRYFPAECEASYDRLFPVAGQGPDPRSVASLAIDPGGPAGMRAAEAVLPELVGRTMTGNVTPTEVPTRASLGSRSWLFHTGHANALGANARGSLLVWRQGDLLGATLVGGAGGAKQNDRLALRFARLQSRRMRHPVPYPPSARDDLLVPLDDPALKLPVYWLGRDFDLGDSDDLELTSAYTLLHDGEAPPGTRLELWYSQGALRIGTWTAATWKEYATTKLGRELLTWRCTRTTSIPVAGGEATVYRGYSKDYASCPAKPPPVAAAVVQAGPIVLGLNLPACYTCIESGLTAAQTEAVVRGLRVRPQRQLSATR